jgi:hypothetical protein
MDDPWMPPISMDFSTSSMDIHPDGPGSIHGSPYAYLAMRHYVTSRSLVRITVVISCFLIVEKDKPLAGVKSVHHSCHHMVVKSICNEDLNVTTAVGAATL